MHARSGPGGDGVALGARLELRQGQSLVITPQLQQAIKLLQLSNLELDAFVEAELERNPLLARDDREGEAERGEAEAREEVRSDASEASESSPDDLDVRGDDLYGDASPGERSTGEAAETGAAAGTAVDW